jgi:hypothetical protein
VLGVEVGLQQALAAPGDVFGDKGVEVEEFHGDYIWLTAMEFELK